MYARLIMELDSNEINYRNSSNLQGVIMENIASEYAEELHKSQLNPYSQYLVKKQDKIYWHIHTVTDEAYEKILLPMARLKEVEIKKKNITAHIANRKIETEEEKALVDEFYEKDCAKYLKLRFLTPTAFKRDGRYVIYPDLHLVYGSLMRKYNEASEELGMIDEEVLDQLTEKSSIVRYRLQTIDFPVEKVKIGGFIGEITIHILGGETLARYVRMLCRFGEISGIGIKTGMGMGAMEFNQGGRE